MGLRAVAVTLLVLLLGGCGSSPVVTVDSTVPSPYAGPMRLPVSHDDDASVEQRSGAAGRALECAGAPYDGGGADYESGLASVQDDPAAALENLLREDGQGPVPTDGYLVERVDGDRVLLSYDVRGRTVVAFVAADDIRDFDGDHGWGIEAWAQCDPAELPARVTDALGIEVWQDRAGRRVPLSRVESFRGPEHCGWQDVTFLRIGADERREYVRDTSGGLDDLLRSTYDGTARLPAQARATGYRRHGRELWLDPGSAAYLVRVGDRRDVERWPATREPIRCA